MDEGKNIYIATNIGYLRNITKTTQHQLAVFLGYVDGTISNWEKGIREPDLVDIKKIADFFNISVDDLLNKDLRYSRADEKKTNIQTVKNNIRNLPEEDMNVESKESLIHMVDTLHNLSKKE